jgi:uncharacterized membrane protein
MPTQRTKGTDQGVGTRVRRTFLAGVGVLIPVVVTAYVLLVSFQTLTSMLDPVATFARQRGVDTTNAVYLAQASAVGVLAVVVYALGWIARFTFGRRAVGLIDTIAQRIPAVGALYRSARQLSNALFSGRDAGSQFKDVKIVEFPHEGTYSLAFRTADTPEEIRTVVAPDDPDMVTVFIPLAPNPVMGGFLTNVARERVHDVDMTTTQAFQTILTTGMATDAGTDAATKFEFVADAGD